MKKNVKKALTLVLALIVALSIVACGDKTSPNNESENNNTDTNDYGNLILTFGTGDTGGALYPAGAAVSQAVTNNVQGVKCNTQTSTGSFQNVIDVASGNIDLGLATADVVLNGYQGTGKFEEMGPLENIRVIGATFESVSSAVALKSSGLEYIHDCIGKRVSVGPAASAAENASLDAFKVMGINSSNTSIENLGIGDSADSVGDGILDAAFGFTGVPIGSHLNLAATKDIQILKYTQDEINSILALNEAYIQTKIPAETYPGQNEDIDTFGVKCLIIVSADMDEELVYDICKAINENTKDMAAGNVALVAMTDPSFLCTQMPIPLHDGAQKYYSEQGLI